MTTPPEPTAPTPAAQWRRASQEGELYTLPGSGHVARLRRPSLLALLAAGASPAAALPADLARLAFVRDGETPDEEEQIALTARNARAYEACAVLCFVSPRVIVGRAPDYGADEIAPSDLADRDLLWLYNTFVMGSAALAAPFRVPDSA